MIIRQNENYTEKRRAKRRARCSNGKRRKVTSLEDERRPRSCRIMERRRGEETLSRQRKLLRMQTAALRRPEGHVGRPAGLRSRKERMTQQLRAEEYLT